MCVFIVLPVKVDFSKSFFFRVQRHQKSIKTIFVGITPLITLKIDLCRQKSVSMQEETLISLKSRDFQPNGYLLFILRVDLWMQGEPQPRSSNILSTIFSDCQQHHINTLVALEGFTEKYGFVTATKLGTTNKFFVAATKNFAAATKRFVDRT